jgi:arylamine N-acetyltransferase
MRIIFPRSRKSYNEAISLSINFGKLEERRQAACDNLFKEIIEDPNHNKFTQIFLACSLASSAKIQLANTNYNVANTNYNVANTNYNIANTNYNVANTIFNFGGNMTP